MRVVICGGGILGAATAYYLTRRGAKPVVVERTGLACAASGKAGGFLALDWCDRSPLEALARRSFALHARLPEELDGDWGYRRLTTYSGSDRARAGAGRGADRSWLSETVALDGRLGTAETTAQVHPGELTAALMRAAEAAGAEFQIGEVCGIGRAGGDGPVRNVDLVGGGSLRADAVVIAMGPWSLLAAQWLPVPLVYGSKGHSILFDTGDRMPAEALFLEAREESGMAHSPEIFPRGDGTTWVCAISSRSPLPLDPADVVPDPGAMDRLEALAGRLSPVLAGSKVIARQACFRPVTADGLPLIGAVPGVPGAFVATGHSVWGILNAPATGEALADLVLDGGMGSVDLSPFDPGRLDPVDVSRLRFGSASPETGELRRDLPR